MRILFVTSNRLGDAVLSTGLLDHLLRAHPAARFTIVCGPVAQGVFARMPNRERTIVLRKQPHGRHWLGLWAAVAPHVWDLVVDIRGSALAWLVVTRRRAVFRRLGGPKIAELGALLDLSPPPLPVAWIDQSDRSFVAALLPDSGPILALAPTANWPPKVWPADRFAAVAHAFPALTPVVLGAPGETERAMAAPLLAALPGAIDLTGRLTLPQVSAVLARAALFVGNDSGLMHMAAAAGAPTVGLFGPTDAATYGPAGPRAVAVKAASMDAITVAQVVTAARSVASDSATSFPAVSSTRSALA
jgi:ADP-heptose:LPS heptosyltransferase